MTDTKRIIRGSKGGSPPPPKPTREPDTLHSRQYATFLDLISEGEIEGFATASKEGRTKGTTAYNNAALKDVFLNDTPVIRASADSTDIGDGDRNFQNVTFNPRFGAGRGFGKIFLGAALIGLSFLSFGTSAGMGVAFSKGLAKVGLIQKGLFGVGAALTLSGVSDILFPLPKFDDFDSEEDPRLSFSFNGIQQTNRAGTPVPIVYGEIFTGSVVIRASVDTEQVQA